MVASNAHWDKLITKTFLDCSSLPPVRGARAKPKAGVWFNVQKRSSPESCSSSLAKKPYLDAKPDSHQSCQKSAAGESSS